MTPDAQTLLHEAAHALSGLRLGATFAEISAPAGEDFWQTHSDVFRDGNIAAMITTTAAGPIVSAALAGIPPGAFITRVQHAGSEAFERTYNGGSDSDASIINVLYSPSRHVLPTLVDLTRHAAELVAPLLERPRWSVLAALGRDVDSGRTLRFTTVGDLLAVTRGEVAPSQQPRGKQATIAAAKQLNARARRALRP